MSAVQRRLARFNRTFANRFVGPVLTRMPGFGAVVHTGRKSGRAYRTPVKVFKRGPHYVMSLPYGPQSDWVRNTVAAGGCELHTRGRHIRLHQPHVFTDPQQAVVPAPLRPLLRRFKAFDFIELRPLDTPATAPARP
ncbi:nitroreductase family deazaflavin-dependent oxidoreductase [Streptomyces sp. NBC_00554]|uniref:nitroreductase family deazaflavin-dependent oxidoreductase n=1 Tax=unclassified Streptomyces TaxID=2593676 RepID=UPI00324F20D1|nr:nitroreductase family deazaflavin-dependent oxidoreductase [Streptomyces sp. NBC_00554]